MDSQNGKIIIGIDRFEVNMNVEKTLDYNKIICRRRTSLCRLEFGIDIYTPSVKKQLARKYIKQSLISCVEEKITPEFGLIAELDLDLLKNKVLLSECRQVYGVADSFPDWWIQFGDEVPELRRLAVRVLYLTCSPSACWTMFNQVHTKIRNPLSSQKKLNGLVYIKKKKLNGLVYIKKLKVMDSLEVDHLLAMFDQLQMTNEHTSSSTRCGGHGSNKRTNAREACGICDSKRQSLLPHPSSSGNRILIANESGDVVEARCVEVLQLPQMMRW